MKMKIKRVLFWTVIPLFAMVLTVVYRYSAAYWFPNVPILECPQSLDLGEWAFGETAIGRFRIRNGGREFLIVDDFFTSCSCAGVDREINGRFSRVKSIRLAPGDEIELVARVGIGVQPGERQFVQVSFRTNDPIHPSWQVDVIVPRVKGGFFAEPSAVTFGPLSIGEKTERIIDLYDNHMPGRRVENIHLSPPNRFTVTQLPLSEGEKHWSHPTAGKLFARLKITPRSDCPGTIGGEIHVTLVNEKHPLQPIPVIGEVLASSQCRPSVLVLPWRVENRPIRAGEVLIFNRRERLIDVVVDSLPPQIAAEVRIVSGRPDQRFLHVEWRSMANQQGQSIYETRIYLRIHSEGEETKLEVPILLTENPS